MKSPYENLIGDRIATEREIFLSAIKSVKSDYREVHELEWEEKQNLEEIEKLEKQLSDLNSQLIGGKEEIKENEEYIMKLKKEQEEDRVRIQRLLAITQPTTRDHTYFYDEAFMAFEQHHHSKSRPRRQKEASHQNANQEESQKADAEDDCQLYTLEIHKAVMKNLSEQYNDLQNLALKNVDILLDDEKQLQKDHDSNMRDLANLKRRVEQRLQASESQLNFTTKNYLALKRKAVVAYQKSMADKEKAAALQKQMAKEEERIRLQSELKLHLLQNSLERDLNLKVKTLQTRLHDKEAMLYKLELEYADFQKEKAEELKGLKNGIHKFKKKIKRIESERTAYLFNIVEQFKGLRSCINELEVLRAKQAGIFCLNQNHV